MDRSKLIPVGFDTETTGLFAPKYKLSRKRINGDIIPSFEVRHAEKQTYCYPYLVTFVSRYDIFHPEPLTTFDEQGYEWVYTFPVDPKTRLIDTTQCSHEYLCAIYDIVTNPNLLLIAHNAKFDIGMLRALFSLFPNEYQFHSDTPASFWASLILNQVDDTVGMMHAVDSSQQLELKPLCVKWLGMSSADESDLKEHIDQLRVVAKDKGYAIASLTTLPYLTKAPKRGWAILDTWLPFVTDDDGNALSISGQSLAITYCVTDSWRTLLLHEFALTKLVELNQLKQYDRHRTAFYSTFRIEERGISINVPAINKKVTALRQAHADCILTINAIGQQHLPPRKLNRFEELRAKHYPEQYRQTCDLNINSDQQMAQLLHDWIKWPCSHLTESGQKCMQIGVLTDYYKQAVEQGNTEVVTMLGSLIASKKYAKGLEYLLAYLKKEVEGRLYPSLNPNGTGTTRLASSDPNGQNIGKGALNETLMQLVTEGVSLKSVFGPEKGYEWFSCDYVQLQLVIFAIVTGDLKMKRAVERGDDFHEFMAREAFGISPEIAVSEDQRRVAKAINFGYIFGAGESKVETTAKRKGLFQQLKHIFPNATSFIKLNMSKARRDGYIETANSYKLTIPFDKPHAATNYIIQGTEGEIVKEALFRSYEYLDAHCPDGSIVLTVHDEILYEFPKGQGRKHIPHLVQIMIDAGADLATPIPLRVDTKYIPYGKSWNEGTKVTTL
jgi:hypothetical protein